MSNDKFRQWRARRKKSYKTHLKASAVYIADDTWKLYINKDSSNNLQPLACHGASILAISKIILLLGIEFLLKHLRPDKAQLLYLDTDSMHIALHKENFEDNIASHLKKSFQRKKQSFFDVNFAPAGILVVESKVDYEYIFAEKFYILKMKSEHDKDVYVTNSSFKSLACKGIPQKILKEFDSVTDELDPSYGYQESCISRMGANLPISNSVRYKSLGGLVIPSRRFFLDSFHSIPLVFSEEKSSIRYNNTILDNRHYLYKKCKNSKDKNKKCKRSFSSMDTNISVPNDQITNSAKRIKKKSRKYSTAKQIKSKASKPFSLEKSLGRVKDSLDIVDTAYKEIINDEVRSEIWSPPRKKKKCDFIQYECKM